MPAGELPAFGRFAKLRVCLENPVQLRAGEIGIEDEAGLGGEPGLVGGMFRQKSVVRRSCQTMARPSGRPLARSQTTTVSRWLVMPTAAIFRLASGAGDGFTHRPRHRVPDVLGLVLDPAVAGIVLLDLLSGDAEDAKTSSASYTTARELVVPWSMAEKDGRGHGLSAQNPGSGLLANELEGSGRVAGVRGRRDAVPEARDELHGGLEDADAHQGGLARLGRARRGPRQPRGSSRGCTRPSPTGWLAGRCRW